ncbi:conjugal transfer pilus assembly protein TrbC [Vibrio crassostreae]|uniref:type-F conjugative transfer system pilin assembly protein TrbC n=3 Tax=Vibrio crassostreae TaxID=246167 RepID=UPI00104C7386|nr:type-F conjugative transfer system pilin assembly protein TrbC [Vibrio crassostreae]TCT63328.1 conjugal transfer pilus assembly protein TrbC [Vibrio crassostreae]TCT84191.1 conjugal transfer pilus assembly protein TrbC [Vibrio crassostreae]TCU04599.1 conjugal transfer pilus assembly protein TrbC [Vibrio crassostreae]CAK1859553.1 conjugal transfer pilus assembly protein TrbC [Vibrio crassostreae]CAK2148475.1 conjugal transfer pilus assembly protein TrbC [Vibrio crassostreae]
MSFSPRASWLLLILLVSPLSLAEKGYSQEELKALAKQEQTIAAPTNHSELTTLLERGQQHKQEALSMNQHLDNALQDSPLASVLGVLQKNPNKKAQGVMVFVSLSMPDNTLKQLLKQSQQYQVPLIIRGVLPEGMVPTASRIMDLLEASDEGEATDGGFAISPQWFRQFNITHVPVFVAIGNACNETSCPKSAYDLVHGNLALPNALTILSQGDVGHIAKQVLNRSSP